MTYPNAARRFWRGARFWATGGPWRRDRWTVGEPADWEIEAAQGSPMATYVEEVLGVQLTDWQKRPLKHTPPPTPETHSCADWRQWQLFEYATTTQPGAHMSYIPRAERLRRAEKQQRDEYMAALDTWANDGGAQR